MGKVYYFIAGILALAAVLCGAGYFFLKTHAHGFSARAEPTALETFVAHTVREMAVPSEAREKKNPIADSDAARAEGRAHWADHCALCHANDGSGQTEIGRQMYPPAPDMRREDTQRMTDGELFYIIENGIRMGGMPSWGSGTERDQQDSWKLVRFIRSLPTLTAAELEQMKEMNPKSPEEFREEQEEREFLNGGQPHEHPQHQHH